MPVYKDTTQGNMVYDFPLCRLDGKEKAEDEKRFQNEKRGIKI